MPRKLKAFTTSAGFFDLAVAAPSMKAALAAWGADGDLFHQGFARRTDDAAIVAATTARPGVVLRRPVGTDGPFTETAEISESVLVEEVRKRPGKRAGKTPGKPRRGGGDTRSSRPPPKGPDGDPEQQEKRRLAKEKREAEAEARAEKRREKAVAAAEAAFRDGEAAHRHRVEALDRERASLDRKASAEESGWAREKARLRDTLRRARR